jgi:hypothetical protein
VLKNGKPEFAVECKSGGRTLSKNIVYFSQRTSIPAFYQVHLLSDGEDSEWVEAKARIMPFRKFSEEMKL